MNINTIDENLLKEKMKMFVEVTGQTINNIYNNYLYPFFNLVIDLHILKIKDKDKQHDARQNIHILLLRRLKKIDVDKIISLKNFFFIMIKRLLLNEIDKIKLIEKKNRELINKAITYNYRINNSIVNNENVFILIDENL